MKLVAKMHCRAITVALLFAMLLLLAACESEPTPSPYEGYLTEEIPPCTPVTGSSVDPCDPGAERFEGSIAPGSLPDLGDEPWSIREMLAGPLPGFRVPHLMLRVSYLPDTVRCTAGDHYRPPPYLADEWDERSFKCYVDVRANAYLLGSGPPTLTVLFFIDYVYASYAEEGLVEKQRQQFEALFSGLFQGREHVIFLGPPDDLSSEAWRFLGYWDVQRREDGTVIAVHPDRDHWRSLRPDDYQTYRSMLEMDLPALTQAVTTANQARVSEFGGRTGADAGLPLLVTDANQLRQYYTSVGAYDHPDGTPVPPPPVPGEGDPVPTIGVDDSTPESTPPVPGEEDSTPTVPGGLVDSTPTPPPVP